MNKRTKNLLVLVTISMLCFLCSCSDAESTGSEYEDTFEYQLGYEEGYKNGMEDGESKTTGEYENMIAGIKENFSTFLWNNYGVAVTGEEVSSWIDWMDWYEIPYETPVDEVLMEKGLVPIVYCSDDGLYHTKDCPKADLELYEYLFNAVFLDYRPCRECNPPIIVWSNDGKVEIKK